MNVSVIGSVTGLVTAYKLSKEGYKVTIFESSYFLGGQASVVNLGNLKSKEVITIYFEMTLTLLS